MSELLAIFNYCVWYIGVESMILHTLNNRAFIWKAILKYNWYYKI